MLIIFYPAVSVVPFMHSPAIGSKTVGIGGRRHSFYLGSKESEESIDTNVVVIGYAKVLRIFTIKQKYLVVLCNMQYVYRKGEEISTLAKAKKYQKYYR